MYSIDTKQKSLMMLMFVACGMIILIHVHQWARNNTFWGPSHLSKCCPVFLKQVADDNDMSMLMLRYQAISANNKISNIGAIEPVLGITSKNTFSNNHFRWAYLR